MPVRETLILSRRHTEVGWPVPFFAAFNFHSVATRYPFAAGWTVSEHPNYDPRVRLEPSMSRLVVKRSNHLATRLSLNIQNEMNNCEKCPMANHTANRPKYSSSHVNLSASRYILLFTFRSLSDVLYPDEHRAKKSVQCAKRMLSLFRAIVKL